MTVRLDGGTRFALGLVAAFTTAVVIGGCLVDFEVDQANAFSCSTDADCIAPFVCKPSSEGTGGVCAEERTGPDDPCIDEDNDGFGVNCLAGDDCDDGNGDVYPGAPELCDNLDNDCDCERDAEGKAIDCEVGTQINEIITCASDTDCPDDPNASSGVACIKEGDDEMGTCMYRCNLNVGVCVGKFTVCTTIDDGNGGASGSVNDCGQARPDGVIPYGDSYQAVSEGREMCDMLDNNCNGVVDGECQTCDPDNRSSCGTDVGICVTGVRECIDGVPGTQCVDEVTDEPVPEPGDVEETCNGLDDDCDNVVDNIAGVSKPSTICPDGCPIGMMLVIDPNAAPGNDRWCIDQYEASRPDATATSMGEDTTRAVSQPGVMPWTGLTVEQAQSACNGPQTSTNPRKSLCQLREIQFACEGANANTYPYGDAYDNTVCNGADAGIGTVVPSGPTDDAADTDFAQCFAERNSAQIYDLSGNVTEFILEDNLPRVYGGSFMDSSDKLTCTSVGEGQGQSGPQIGFRCCIDPQLP